MIVRDTGSLHLGGASVKHYYAPMSRAATTDWMLRELDAPHERVLVDIRAGEQNLPEYREISPTGKVPALVDGDVVVTETAAICAYLADRFPDRGFAPSIESSVRGSYYRYLFFPGTTLEPLLSVTSLGIDDYNAVGMGFGDTERQDVLLGCFIDSRTTHRGERVDQSEHRAE